MEDFKRKLFEEQQTKGGNLLAVERLEEEYEKIVREKNNLQLVIEEKLTVIKNQGEIIDTYKV